MRKIALATSNEYADLTADNRELLNKLLFWGVDVEPIVWSSRDLQWNQYDAVFIRSCWDYHLHYDEFLKWIDLLENEGVAVFNSPAILRWNSNKRYLRELREKGINLVPTVWMDKNSSVPLQEILNQNGWGKAVIKPCIAADAYGTCLTSENASRDEEMLRAMLEKHGDIIVQKFIPEIQKFGEWSFIFFDGQFSHAVIKKPHEGDFRVQEKFGGTSKGQRPPRELVAQASKALQVLPDAGLYARVDAIQVDRTLLLVELEMLEPTLFFDRHPKAVTRFADCILTRVNELAVSQGLRQPL